MKYIEEFRDREACKKIAEKIYALNYKDEITLMEVCGTHTMSISRYGIKKLLPSNITLLSGPGCPVCVTPNSELDRAIAYSRLDNTIITTFGDMVRVPGSSSSLLEEKSQGGDIRIVYAVTDALKIAQQNPHKKIIFLGVGFETTSPTIAASIMDTSQNMVENYFVLTMHKLIPPAMKALLENKEVNISGFILPGHVSTITGTEIYNFIASDYSIPCCVAGFEPSDILRSIFSLVKQINDGKSEIQNEYKRAVRKEGNVNALALLDEVFEPCDTEWRGIGLIPESGLKIKKKYSDFDAKLNIPVDVEPTNENPECICGDILCGVKTPKECKLFGNVCCPENPIGACMVSSEGTCSAYYKYER